MNKKKLKVLAAELAKGLKTEADLTHRLAKAGTPTEKISISSSVIRGYPQNHLHYERY
jgi:hypothetical protein